MKTVRTTDRGSGVRVLTLDRPPANAEDETLLGDLSAALDDAGGDAAVRAVVLTGAGKFFSGGFDLSAPRREDEAVAVMTTLFRDTHVKLLEGSTFVLIFLWEIMPTLLVIAYFRNIPRSQSSLCPAFLDECDWSGVCGWLPCCRTAKTADSGASDE